MLFKKIKIKEIGEISTGNTPSKNRIEYYENNDILFIKPDDLLMDRILKIRKSKEHISFLAEKIARIVSEGSILFTCIGTIGKIGIVDKKKAAFNQQINAITPNKNIADTRYLAYLLKYNKEKIRDYANAPVVPIINKTQFGEIELMIHLDLQLQRKIASILDKSQELIEKRKEQIEECVELIKCLFYEMFGDPILNSKSLKKAKLRDIGDWKSGGTPSRANANYYKGTISWLSSGELNNMYTYSSEEHITEEALSNSSAKLIPKGSLLLGMYDSAALKSTINLVECTCNQAVAYAELNSKLVSTIFVYFCIQLSKEFYKIQQRGVRQKNFNLSMIKDLEIILPDFFNQNLFAERVRKIETQKQLFEKSLTELENNFNALMQKAFKGELL